MLRFVYRGKEYGWEEWHEEKKKFVDKLELPDDLLIDWGLRDASIAHDRGYSIAMDKYRELYYLIASARNALINSFDKFYESNIIQWGSDYKAHIWMRSEYLKNSIIWYNSCEDYIYQAIWFAFEMGGGKISSREDYEKQLKKVCYKSIKSKLEEQGTAESKELLSYINDYRFDENVKYMRETLANNLKHRGNLNFMGIEDNRMLGFEIQDENKNMVFELSWIEPLIIDIDETIGKMSQVHEELINFARKIKDFINFDEMFELDEEGNIVLGLIKDKREYKKIIFD